MKSLSKAGPPDSHPEETIRRRAYEIYETHGKQDGHDREHWLRAEAEVGGQPSQSIADESSANASSGTPAVEAHEPRFTKIGPLVAPKYGFAGSGGAEYELLPEAYESTSTR